MRYAILAAAILLMAAGCGGYGSKSKSGVVSFYCKYHKSMGMAGALTGGGNGGMSGGGETGTGSTSTGKGY